MPRKVTTAPKSKAARGDKISRQQHVAPTAEIESHTFNLDFVVDCRRHKVALSPIQPLGSERVFSGLSSRMAEVIVSVLQTHEEPPKVDLLISFGWYPVTPAIEFNLADYGNELQEALTLFGGYRKKYECVTYRSPQGYCFSVGRFSRTSKPVVAFRSSELVVEGRLGGDSPRFEAPAEPLSNKVSRIKTILTDIPPEQQLNLGEFIAREYERCTGQPAAFITFSSFFSELVGVRGASRQLKRSRSAVTTYVQDGLLPAIRLDEKQYVFFKKHLDEFNLPKKGPKAGKG